MDNLFDVLYFVVMEFQLKCLVEVLLKGEPQKDSDMKPLTQSDQILFIHTLNSFVLENCGGMEVNEKVFFVLFFCF